RRLAERKTDILVTIPIDRLRATLNYSAMEERMMKISGKFRTRSLVLAITAAFSTGIGIANAQATSCEDLATLAFPDTTITAAQTLPAGPTTIIGTTAPGTTSPVFGTFTGTIPVPICRVRGTIKPTSV